jgi:hypothetical protein
MNNIKILQTLEVEAGTVRDRQKKAPKGEKQ